ncbi:hypothetical protein PTTG_25561 [Puccinia triticina 1-1 BBBD Race 1]|uniref:Secreted protein n=2 Tax=Puccinia triticina TaxID=208348 RepID=A0A180H2R8_PUCT1|nr:uncharacterized protein PtA15_5A750 [Puccinia triticina]OAV98928.1 hypothetical protein PTTG_25561 [Puccinia triticina 1-1 BBBD Race 1]WAQ85176.1 hypothetical protein PtA15_5A750 [Puccinia triticina]WAR58513.1 hypothetical protein PtB15_5B747 [Puccinia triticina]
MVQFGQILHPLVLLSVISLRLAPVASWRGWPWAWKTAILPCPPEPNPCHMRTGPRPGPALFEGFHPPGLP